MKTTRTLPIAVCVFALVSASSAVGAQPKGPACWGPTKIGCNGLKGPVGGNLNVSGGLASTIFRFADSEPCLGVSNGLENEIDILATIPVKKDGSFSYKGRGSLVGPTQKTVPVTLAGRFTSTTSATVTFGVSYKSCKTAHLRLRYPG